MEKSIHVDDFVVIVNDNYFLKKVKDENNEKDETIKQLEQKIKDLEKEKEEIVSKYDLEEQKMKEELAKEKKMHFDLKRRYADVIKTMCEVLKIKQAVGDDDNIEQIRTKVTQLVYHELRLHSAIPFSSIMGTLRVHTRADGDKSANINRML